MPSKSAQHAVASAASARRLAFSGSGSASAPVGPSCSASAATTAPTTPLLHILPCSLAGRVRAGAGCGYHALRSGCPTTRCSPEMSRTRAAVGARTARKEADWCLSTSGWDLRRVSLCTRPGVAQGACERAGCPRIRELQLARRACMCARARESAARPGRAASEPTPLTLRSDQDPETEMCHC